MASFYGWSPDVVENMEYITALEYYVAIDCIEAQKILMDMQVSIYPKLTKEGQKQLHRKIHRKAYPEGMQKQMSFEDFARKMNGGRKNNSRA